MLLRLSTAQKLILAAAAGALGFAYLMQYGFHLAPCELCLWQRLPYGLILAIGIFGFFARKNGRHYRLILPSMLVLLIAEWALAIFHVGVEGHWWRGLPGCTAQPFDGTAAAIMAAPIVPCDSIAWSFLHISMPGWNAIYATALSLYGLAVFYKARTAHHAA